MLNTVINKLKEFSKEDFPVPEVSSYLLNLCLLYTSPSPRDLSTARMPAYA